ncbi:DNA polymerase family B, putative [Cryptosporidium muris RN66]|uniref:DNA-directed DNA polymerase n=1 Tax=Cryptosporidium muris (strain RN66) TaxID=441375 RepID=B6AJK1_CRYMR|nr:DNA polymerase family B, putative [Cryptosporidium muris RN66]EEA08392.1 DNA polymerase family B, putative [Cryptosporidium muris RN66]|eukprot:XP_002142741.1 DNA polymerase family B [Cryptosporidium muris RN66]
MVIEPNSSLQYSPVTLLGFQSLYPSIMMAYNMCFSTILGNIHTSVSSDNQHINEITNKLGTKNNYPWFQMIDCIFKEYANIELLSYHTDNINFNRNIMKKTIRQGLLPQLIDEILKIRLMLKECKSCYELYREEIMNNYNQKTNYAKNKLSNYSIHEYSSVIKSIDSTLKYLEYRQLGLKLFMNILYGYAAASFCGRIPLSDLADSIIMTARDTNAQIIYGDTDSVFVKLEGRSLQEAFTITNNIVDTVTSMNPFPIKLNTQGVLLPCLLISKKKYPGFIYEKIGNIWNESTPKFICRGNKIIRRDQCQLVKSTFSKVLIDLFQNRDISSVKRILINVREQIFLDNIPINDYIFYGGLHSNQFKKKIVNSCHLTPESKNLYRNIGNSIKKLLLVMAPSSFGSVVFPEETILGWKHLTPLLLLLLPSKYSSIKANRTSDKDTRIFYQWHVHELLISGLEKQNNEPKFSVDFSRYYIDYILKPLNRILGLIPILFKSYILSRLHFVDIEDLVPSKQLCTTPALNTNKICQVSNPYYHCKQASINEYFYYKCSICNKVSHIANRKSNTRSKYIICKSCMEDGEQTFALIGSNLNSIENKLYKINKICLNCSGCGFQSPCMPQCMALSNLWHKTYFIEKVKLLGFIIFQ